MSKEMIFSGKLIKVFTSTKDLPNGRKGYFEQVEHPGASLVLPVVGNKIVFIRQYRGVIDRNIWELPAGIPNKGETPYLCAKRELTEETGYKAGSVKLLGKIYTSPGFCNEIIHIFKAECVTRGKTVRDADECMKVHHFTRHQVRSLFKRGKITDSKTIAALAFAGII